MNDFELTVDTEALLERLKEVQQRRDDYDDGNPPIQYCLTCDEYCFVVEEDVGEYRRLDCRDEHFEYIIEDTHTNAEISSWINCLEHIGVDDEG